jgi:predicted O-methyltransferase YrrM
MPQEQWTAVDHYINGTLLPADEALDAALEANAAAGLPAIDVAPNQGKFLQLLAQLCGARRILEVGTLGGYSTICLARALPAGGKLITLEVDPKHAAVATSNISRAGLAQKVEVRCGPALESLARLAEEPSVPFDMIFIDADKPNNPNYLDWALKLSHVGTLIVLDNVIREGGVTDPASQDANVQGVQRAFEKIAADPRLSATALQTVGSKGWDGFAMMLVVSE